MIFAGMVLSSSCYLKCTTDTWVMSHSFCDVDNLLITRSHRYFDQEKFDASYLRKLESAHLNILDTSHVYMRSSIWWCGKQSSNCHQYTNISLIETQLRHTTLECIVQSLFTWIFSSAGTFSVIGHVFYIYCSVLVDSVIWHRKTIISRIKSKYQRWLPI